MENDSDFSSIDKVAAAKNIMTIHDQIDEFIKIAKSEEYSQSISDDEALRKYVITSFPLNNDVRGTKKQLLNKGDSKGDIKNKARDFLLNQKHKKRLDKCLNEERNKTIKPMTVWRYINYKSLLASITDNELKDDMPKDISTPDNIKSVVKLLNTNNAILYDAAFVSTTMQEKLPACVRMGDGEIELNISLPAGTQGRLMTDQYAGGDEFLLSRNKRFSVIKAEEASQAVKITVYVKI